MGNLRRTIKRKARARRKAECEHNNLALCPYCNEVHCLDCGEYVQGYSIRQGPGDGYTFELPEELATRLSCLLANGAVQTEPGTLMVDYGLAEEVDHLAALVCNGGKLAELTV
jgi:hypothetical protein